MIVRTDNAIKSSCAVPVSVNIVGELVAIPPVVVLRAAEPQRVRFTGRDGREASLDRVVLAPDGISAVLADGGILELALSEDHRLDGSCALCVADESGRRGCVLLTQY